MFLLLYKIHGEQKTGLFLYEESLEKTKEFLKETHGTALTEVSVWRSTFNPKEKDHD